LALNTNQTTYSTLQHCWNTTKVGVNHQSINQSIKLLNVTI